MFDETRRPMKVATSAEFRLDLYEIVFTWVDTLHDLRDELPQVPRDYLNKMTPAKLQKLAEWVAEEMSIEAIQVYGHRDFSPLYAPVLRFEVVLDMLDLCKRFWESLTIPYTDENDRPLLPKKVADAFEAIPEDEWLRLRPYLLDALERDFRAYLEIEN